MTLLSLQLDDFADLALRLKYSPSQPRASDGRWTDGGSGISLKLSSERAWSGEQTAVSTTMSKQESGRLGEAIAVAHIQRTHPDAGFLNTKKANYAVDLIGDHEVYEAKTGLVSNSRAAQQWRATIGQPGKAEAAWLKTASPADKAAWNAQKQKAIHDRKAAALKEVSASVGKRVKGRTITTIIDPDRKLVDVFEFEGFHSRIPWRGAKPVASYSYG